MKTVINIKADKEVKIKAQEVARELGVPLSMVVNTYLKQFIRDKEIYLTAVPRMSPKLERLLAKVEEDLKMGRNISGPFTTGKEMDEYLDSL